MSSTIPSAAAPLGPVMRQAGSPASVTTGSASTAAADAQKEARLVLATLKELVSKRGQKAAAREAATQKLALLKAQLKNLTMFFGGDPKARAREAARIAKQIGEAAKDYAQAGGTSANVAAPAPSTTPAAGATDATPPADTGNQSTATNSTPASSGTTAAGPAGASGPATGSSSKTADQAFIGEAKLLARRANAILLNALRETRRQRPIGDLAADGAKALVAVDKAAFTLGLGRGLGIDAGAGYGASAKFVAALPLPRIAITA